jgi:hypothetical protein
MEDMNILSEKLFKKTIAQAEAIIKHSEHIRAVRVNGIATIVTCDFDKDRINVHIVDGKINRVVSRG